MSTKSIWKVIPIPFAIRARFAEELERTRFDFNVLLELQKVESENELVGLRAQLKETQKRLNRALEDDEKFGAPELEVREALK